MVAVVKSDGGTDSPLAQIVAKIVLAIPRKMLLLESFCEAGGKVLALPALPGRVYDSEIRRNFSTKDELTWTDSSTPSTPRSV